ncbi:MAG: hypothetical protein ABW148_16815, partial [Sedimenticola sp.]
MKRNNKKGIRRMFKLRMKQTVIMVALLLLFLVSVQASAATTINTPTNIAGTDTTYEGQDLVVDGTTLNVEGSHSFNSLTLKNSAVLSHLASAVEKTVIEAKTITVDVSSRIDVSGKGNSYTGQVGSYSGGSYGGHGGVYSSYTTNPEYGNYLAPQEVGTGGHSGNGSKSLGGGSIKLKADTLALEGVIRANGNSTSYIHGGGGSGGSVWLDVGTLSGGGRIEANGGSSGNGVGGGGGGGRVAVYYDALSGFNLATVIAQGGGGSSQVGGTGTVYHHNRATDQAVLQLIGSNKSSAVTQFSPGTLP